MSLDLGNQKPSPLSIQCQRWLKVRLTLDCGAQKYDLALNGVPARQGVPFAEEVRTVERLVFRTGPYRGIGMTPIEPAVDRPIPATVFYINEVTTFG